MQIRDLMGKIDSFKVLKGHVEIDESFFGGKRSQKEGGRKAKTIIVGMKERGGRVETKIVPGRRRPQPQGMGSDRPRQRGQVFNERDRVVLEAVQGLSQ